MSRLIPLIAIFFTLSNINGQNSYIGPVGFDYSGVHEGTFESVIFDTLPSGGALTGTNLDSIWVVVSALDQTAPDTFDLFMALMQDTTTAVHPRTWTIAQTDLENIDFLMLYVPGIDSSFLNQFSSFFPDSSTNADSTSTDSALTLIIQGLLDDVFVSIDGALEIESTTDSSFAGSFYGTFLKGEVTWPLQQINISNGFFSVNKTAFSSLNINALGVMTPDKFSLGRPYPNPFNPTTTLRFVIPTSERVLLNIYNIKGDHIETLIQKQMSVGSHTIQWDASEYSSGIYFAVLYFNGKRLSQKLYLIK
ncbi:MAG: T9SS type A sorting domain-containing protein [Candidatus Marinimicrobia bacterium]|nr:T9SS type A sorting domain-containing protein [Candidatus Neomarinimicrobiota bacterium]